MEMRKWIAKKIKEEYNPILIRVTDESHFHNVPVGSESHFSVLLVSDYFIDQSLLNRHRMIYKTLNAELTSTVHALTLHVYSIQEWKKMQNIKFISPPCISNIG